MSLVVSHRPENRVRRFTQSKRLYRNRVRASRPQHIELDRYYTLMHQANSNCDLYRQLSDNHIRDNNVNEFQ